MFKLEQEEYMKEKINWTFIDFGMDSQMTIDLIDKKPSGILTILDEETILPKATDETFVAKLHEHHERNPGYEKVQFSKITFVVNHYAGKVEYDANLWLEKNKDPLQADLEATMKKSSHQFIVDLFGEEFLLKLDRAPSPGSQGSRQTVDVAVRQKGAQFITQSNHHKEQLNHLMNTLNATNPHFIRCIIPNHRQRPNDLDAIVVLDQLRCNGVLEGIRIARKGFPNRIVYAEFLKRYHLLAPNIPKSAPDAKAQTAALMEHIGEDKERYRFGLTKIFFRAGALAAIEEKREKKIGEIIVDIQTAARAYLARDMYRKLTSRSQAAKTVQRNLRAYLDFKDWMWWKLYHGIKPLIKRMNIENEINSRDSKIKQLTKDLESESANRNKLQKEIEDIQAAVSSLRDELAREKERADAAAEDKRTLEKTRDLLAKRIGDLEKDSFADTENIADLTKAKKAADARLSELEDQLDDEQKKTLLLEQQRKQRESEIDDLKDKLARENDQVAKLSKNAASLESELKDLRHLLDEESDTLSALEKAKKSLQADLEEARDANNDKENKLSNLEKARKKLEADFKELQGKLDDEVNKVDSGNKQVAKLNEDIKSLQHQFDESQKNAAALASAKKET